MVLWASHTNTVRLKDPRSLPSLTTPSLTGQYQQLLLLFFLKAFCLTPSYGPLFLSVVDVPGGVNFQQTHVGRQSVLLGFPQPSDRSCPLRHQPSARLHIIGTVLSFYMSMPPRFPSSHHIRIASTPRRLLSSVLGCLSFRETPHILISILSIFDCLFKRSFSAVKCTTVLRMCVCALVHVCVHEALKSFCATFTLLQSDGPGWQRPSDRSE